ncbi:MAG: helix-turn-helix transcriptional regulator [Ruminococcaceae bacterium]|nr:helix-turn-helix transcriptional regulator [Oscillospiraceae bacterium]
MSFAENLKQIRKGHHLSQEELAELLNVSRQAVSKWEQGQGYPEAEKLMLLSGKLNVSLDALMSSEIARSAASDSTTGTGSIRITSLHENVTTACYKVMASGKMRGGKKSPQYALFGVSSGGSSFWGEPTTFLGWYANQELVSKEIEAIHQAISQGIPTYTLRYSAKTERRLTGIRIIEES